MTLFCCCILHGDYVCIYIIYTLESIYEIYFYRFNAYITWCMYMYIAICWVYIYCKLPTKIVDKNENAMYFKLKCLYYKYLKSGGMHIIYL